MEAGDEESVPHGDSFRVARGRVLGTEGGEWLHNNMAVCTTTELGTNSRNFVLQQFTVIKYMCNK